MKKLFVLSILAVLVLGVTGVVAAEGQVVNIFPAPEGMEIDAELTEWHTAALISGEPRTSTRATGVLYFMYDDENLYVAGEVKDGSPMLNQNKMVPEVYKGDGVEVFIETDPSAPADRENYADTDRQFALVMGPEPHSWMWATNDSLEGTVIKTRVVESETNGGYVFEAKVPLKSIHPDFDLESGMEIGFSAGLDFSNREGTDRDVQQTWNAGSNAPLFAFPRLFGTAVIK